MSRIIKLPDNSTIKEGGIPQESPYRLSLTESKKTTPPKIIDIVDPTREKPATKIVASKPKTNSRKSELVRMAGIATAVVLILNIAQIYPNAVSTKTATLDAAYAGIENIMNVGDIGNAGQAFETATYQFEAAQQALWYLTDEESQITQSNKYLKTATSLLSAAGALSSAGESFADFAIDIQDSAKNLFSDGSEGKPSITAKLGEAYDTYIPSVQKELATAQIYLDEVDTKLLPDKYEGYVGLVRTEVSAINSFLEKLSADFPTLLKLLGDEYQQKYMIMLENNSELRPGGGFMGSFLIVDLNDGYIDNMGFHDVYEYDGSFNEYIEPPVQEIKYLTCCWGLRDANYSPDFVKSAESAAWFFEHEGGPTVDHVLMVDLDFIADIIDILGPIYIENLDSELTGENFELVVSYIVESKLRGEDAPKSVLEEIIPIVKDKITEPENVIAVLGSLMKAAQEKHFAAYSTNEEMQNFWHNLNMDGELYLPKGGEDYLLITTSGIGGNKTDRYTYQNIDHQTFVSKDGSLLDKLTITRENVWDDALANWQTSTLGTFGFTEISDAVKNILGSGDNVAGIRIYVPKNAALIFATGDSEQDITAYCDEDLDLYYYYAVLRTRPGEKSQLELTYTLPFSLTVDPVDDYFLYVETQPGMINTTFEKQIIAPNFNAETFYPDDGFKENTDLTYAMTTDLTSPLHLGGVFSK